MKLFLELLLRNSFIISKCTAAKQKRTFPKKPFSIKIAAWAWISLRFERICTFRGILLWDSWKMSDETSFIFFIFNLQLLGYSRKTFSLSKRSFIFKSFVFFKFRREQIKPFQKQTLFPNTLYNNKIQIKLKWE